MNDFQSPANDKMVELSRSETENVQGGGLLLYAIQKVRCDESRSTATDDVIVDGNIITAENYDSAY